jgi:hypothetical protein
MKRLWALILLLPMTSLTLACGSGSSRQLQSISITQSPKGQQIEFAAKGNFSGSPVTVSAIPAMWSIQLMAPPPAQYTLTPQPFTFDCGMVEQTSSGPIVIAAYAPSNPNAPFTGMWTSVKMIQASVVITCP